MTACAAAWRETKDPFVFAEACSLAFFYRQRSPSWLHDAAWGVAVGRRGPEHGMLRPNARRLPRLRPWHCQAAEQAEPRWQAAVAVLLKAAEHGGPFRFIARVSFGRALHEIEGVGPQPAPRDKGADWKTKRARRKR